MVAQGGGVCQTTAYHTAGSNSVTDRQQRVLFFVHDGSGLGHLRRVCNVAEALQGSCASLVLTGHRAVAWMLSPQSEFVHLPSWDSIDPSRSRYWNRAPWVDDMAVGARLRAKLLAATFDAFAPDAIVVDYHPFGRFNELRPHLERSSARKYLLLRGLIDDEDRDMLCGAASAELAQVFDGIVIACDRRVVDMTATYPFAPAAAERMTYAGYIVTPPPRDRLAVRHAAGVSADVPWVVCSGGGGKLGELLIEECLDVARDFPDAHFDVIAGPRSRFIPPTSVPANCRLFNERHELAEWHGACDVLITPGGYNSLLEGGAGGARLLVRPTQSNADAEPREHAKRLGAAYPVTIAETREALREGLAAFLRDAMHEPRPRFPYATGGAHALRELILARARIGASSH